MCALMPTFEFLYVHEYLFFLACGKVVAGAGGLAADGHGCPYRAFLACVAEYFGGLFRGGLYTPLVADAFLLPHVRTVRAAPHGLGGSGVVRVDSFPCHSLVERGPGWVGHGVIGWDFASECLCGALRGVLPGVTGPASWSACPPKPTCSGRIAAFASRGSSSFAPRWPWECCGGFLLLLVVEFPSSSLFGYLCLRHPCSTWQCQCGGRILVCGTRCFPGAFWSHFWFWVIVARACRCIFRLFVLCGR